MITIDTTHRVIVTDNQGCCVGCYLDLHTKEDILQAVYEALAEYSSVKITILPEALGR